MSENKGTETTTSTIPSEETVIATTVQDDAEAKIAALEAEKASILEREANYKVAYLKEKKKNEVIDPEESDDERTRRIIREEMNASRISQIESDKDTLVKKLAKENKELKLAASNKNGATPIATGTHSESVAVTNTLVTPEQISAFKAKGWTDKDIERYKKNLLRYGK